MSELERATRPIGSEATKSDTCGKQLRQSPVFVDSHHSSCHKNVRLRDKHHKVRVTRL